jgi:hypothetical protein
MYVLVTWDYGKEDQQKVQAGIDAIVPENKRGPELSTCLTSPCSDDEYKATLAAFDQLCGSFPTFSYFAFLISTDTPKRLHSSGQS